MHDRDLDVPSAGDLADCEAELTEWDRLRVRDYWEAVVNEELGEEPDSAEHEPRVALRVFKNDATEQRPESGAHGDEAA